MAAPSIDSIRLEIQRLTQQRDRAVADLAKHEVSYAQAKEALKRLGAASSKEARRMVDELDAQIEKLAESVQVRMEKAREALEQAVSE